MLFNSFQFLVFLPIVIAVYYLLPGKFKKLWLLLTSYYFYMGWNKKYIILILFSTIITYLTGILIEKYNDNICRKRASLVLCLICNFGILAFFKYFRFIINNLNNVLGSSIEPPFSFLLPIGISFYRNKGVRHCVG